MDIDVYDGVQEVVVYYEIEQIVKHDDEPTHLQAKDFSNLQKQVLDLIIQVDIIFKDKPI